MPYAIYPSADLSPKKNRYKNAACKPGTQSIISPFLPEETAMTTETPKTKSHDVPKGRGMGAACESLFWSIVFGMLACAAALLIPTVGFGCAVVAAGIPLIGTYFAVLLFGVVVLYGPFVLPPVMVAYFVYHRDSVWIDRHMQRRWRCVRERGNNWLLLVLGAMCFIVLFFLFEKVVLCKAYKHYGLGNWMICDLPNGDPFLKIMYDLIAFEYHQRTDGRPNFYGWHLYSSEYPITSAVLTWLFR